MAGNTEVDLDVVAIAHGGKLVRWDFLLARRPVTAMEFQGITGDPAPDPAEGPAVKLATWNEAIRYCNLLNLKTGKPPAYDQTTGVLLDKSGAPARDIASVTGFRLPTGAEWDYAARGGRPDPPYADWGAVLDRIYWDDPTSHWAKPVAPRDPVTNAIGLVGMLGFVREWYSHFPRADDVRNRICGWSHYYTNYDCLIAYHVAGEIAAEGATHPLRIALTTEIPAAADAGTATPR
jgi:formylglycine-generating enzyme required for sulfatase activity